MTDRLPSHFIDLVQDALQKSFWYKRALVKFLKRHSIADTFLASLHDQETKRAFLDRLFPNLESHASGATIINNIATSLAEQLKFPDLEGLEDSKEKVQAAKDAVQALKDYMQRKNAEAKDAKTKAEARMAAQQQREEMAAKANSLDTLRRRLDKLSKQQGTPEGGYAFQSWFYDLVAFFEVECRCPYNSGGRQIDGTLTIEGTTYLVELKFTNSQAAVTDVDSFRAKIDEMADNTMGIMLSMSGYSSVAIDKASGKRTTTLLLDYNHVNLILGGTRTMQELICRVRRHASQTGEAFFPAGNFSLS